MYNPTVSIITVSFNAEKHIEETIECVLNQTYPSIEYIIIDGASTDRTLTIIEKYQERITKIISEKDKGLYYAMNKGLQYAKGDYVLFLNADDVLYADDTIEKLLAQCGHSDAIYGDSMLMNASGEALGLRSRQTPHKTPDRLDWRSLRYGMVVSHQSFLIRLSLVQPFDVRYHVCADIDWMIRCLKACDTVCNSGLIISKFRVGGVSERHRRLAWKERYLIFKRHYGTVPNLLNHGYIGLRYLFSKRQ